jgi:hypothetical protein
MDYGEYDEDCYDYGDHEWSSALSEPSNWTAWEVDHEEDLQQSVNRDIDDIFDFDEMVKESYYRANAKELFWCNNCGFMCGAMCVDSDC